MDAYVNKAVIAVILIPTQIYCENVQLRLNKYYRHYLEQW
jgi:hypothetical protein